MQYDYRESVKNDILNYISAEINLGDFENAEELEEHLNDVLLMRTVLPVTLLAHTH